MSAASGSARCQRFRRTLVGLKWLVDWLLVVHPLTFQTYPRGVEVDVLSLLSVVSALFQTYPRGVEVSWRPLGRGRVSCFRRTLVGLKLLTLYRAVRTLDGFQTYPRGVEVS